jgi:CubicO group peptidase (beta-lactamase class C family)
LGLHDRVAEVVPEFGNRGKEAIRVRHLLTHTSGLPDQLPKNHDLRAKHTPLSEFVKRICDLDLLFEPGTRISYQSTGIAILGEIVERLEGRSLCDVLRTLFFDPLGLVDTSLRRLEDRHGGMAWADPETEVTCVFLTNDPDGVKRLRPRVSNAVAAAVI